MENKEQVQKSEQKFGEIRSGLFLQQYVGDGSTDEGHVFRLNVQNDFSPSVYCNGKTFILPWADILQLAELAGLFDSEVTA